jgi:hypothetical protein
MRFAACLIPVTDLAPSASAHGGHCVPGEHAAPGEQGMPGRTGVAEGTGPEGTGRAGGPACT